MMCIINKTKKIEYGKIRCHLLLDIYGDHDDDAKEIVCYAKGKYFEIFWSSLSHGRWTEDVCCLLAI